MTAKISIIHPSRSRPQLAAQTAKKWLSSAKNWKDIQYLLSIDKDDDLYDEIILEYPAQTLVGDNANAIEAINYGASKTEGDLIIVVSDDFDCPFHWDVALLKALEGKSDYLVKTKDGIQKTLITLPIMDRVYYNRFGYIYNPEYEHMFCDQEMTAVGHMLGRVIELDITFPHNHYTTGRFAKDAISVKNDNTWNQGQRVFNKNLATNFGIENPLKPYNQIVWR